MQGIDITFLSNFFQVNNHMTTLDTFGNVAPYLVSSLLTLNLFFSPDKFDICSVVGNTESVLFTGGGHSSRGCRIHG